jgi:hypothetical protein
VRSEISKEVGSVWLVMGTTPLVISALHPLQHACLVLYSTGVGSKERRSQVSGSVAGGRPHLSGWLFWFYPCEKGSQEGLAKRVRSEISKFGRTELGWLEPPLVLCFLALIGLQGSCLLSGWLQGRNSAREIALRRGALWGRFSSLVAGVEGTVPNSGRKGLTIEERP